jgi:hypothetical protein
MAARRPMTARRLSSGKESTSGTTPRGSKTYRWPEKKPATAYRTGLRRGLRASGRGRHDIVIRSARRTSCGAKQRRSDHVPFPGPEVQPVAAGRCLYAKHHRESSVDTPSKTDGRRKRRPFLCTYGRTPFSGCVSNAPRWRAPERAGRPRPSRFAAWKKRSCHRPSRTSGRP